ncbi:MAG: transposase, partial [Cyanobacteria bacterium]|nr:transposase [Cyanobacteriota bacterium]
NGCKWRALPSDFPRWQTVYTYLGLAEKVETIDVGSLQAIKPPASARSIYAFSTFQPIYPCT